MTIRKIIPALTSVVCLISLSVGHARDVSVFIRSGDAKVKIGEFSGAILEYTQALALDPLNRDAYVHRAAAKSLMGDWDGALKDIDKAIAIHPGTGEIYGARALAHINLGDYKAAHADFEAAQKLDAQVAQKVRLKISQDLITRARSKSIAGDNAAAIKDLDMIIGLVPDLAVAYHERGAAKLGLKQYKEAIADLDLAIKFDTWHNKVGDSNLLRSEARRAAGDIEGAEADEAEAMRRSAAAQPGKSPP